MTKQRLIITSTILNSDAIAFDTVEMKLYFDDGRQINVRGNSLQDGNVIIPNANVKKMTVDWIGRRFFWTEESSNRIFVANLDGEEKSVIANALGKPHGIAIDPISG